MKNPTKSGAAGEAKDATSSELAHLAAKVLSDLQCFDFESCRTAAQSITKLRVGIYRQMVDSYDPGDPDGFADLIAFFSTLFNDKREAAAVFGISVSTFYRWKSGETIPHLLMRGSIRERIRCHLLDRTFGVVGNDGDVLGETTTH